jgi:hypothetical protein
MGCSSFPSDNFSTLINILGPFKPFPSYSPQSIVYTPIKPDYSSFSEPLVLLYEKKNCFQVQEAALSSQSIYFSSNLRI